MRQCVKCGAVTAGEGHESFVKCDSCGKDVCVECAVEKELANFCSKKCSEKMKLTDGIIKQATEIIEVKDPEEIDTMFDGIIAKVAKTMVRIHGFYTFTQGENKVLIWMDR